MRSHNGCAPEPEHRDQFCIFCLRKQRDDAELRFATLETYAREIADVVCEWACSTEPAERPCYVCRAKERVRLIEKYQAAEKHGGIKESEPCTTKPEVRSCPCLHTVPCQPGCTCSSPLSSVGCLCCCSYGSPEQQVVAAKRIANAVDGARSDYPISPDVDSVVLVRGTVIDKTPTMFEVDFGRQLAGWVDKDRVARSETALPAVRPSGEGRVRDWLKSTGVERETPGSVRQMAALWAHVRDASIRACATELERAGRASPNNSDASYAIRGAELLRAMVTGSEDKP